MTQLLERAVSSRRSYAAGAAALYACAAVAASFPSGTPLEVAIRLALAVVVVVFLPGHAVMRALGWFSSAEADRERLPLAFGVGYGIVTVLCAVSAVLHLSLAQAFALLAACTMAVALAPARRADEDGPPRRGSRLSLALVGAMAFVVACAWVLEAPLTGEETVELISIRKIVENPFISIDGIMPEPGVIPTYLITPYYFFVALVSKAAGVSMFAAYLKLRCLYAALALLTISALAGRLFKNLGAPLTDAVALGLVVIFIADPDPWIWPASMFPLVRRGAVTAGVVAPVFMLAMLVYVRRTLRRGVGEWIAPGLMALSLLTTHGTEVIHAGFFVVAVVVSRLAAERLDISWRRVAEFCASAAVTAVTFKSIHAELVPHVYAFFESAQTQALTSLKMELARGLSSFAGISDAGRYLVSASGAVLPYTIVGILLTPLLIGLEPAAGTFVWAAALIPLAVYCSSKLYVLLQLATSSEILFVFSYFTLFGIISLLTLAFVFVNAVLARAPLLGAAWSATRRVVVIAIVAAIFGRVVAALVLRTVTSVLVSYPLLLPWATAAGGIGVLWLRGTRRADRDTHVMPLATLAMVAMVAGVAVGLRGFPGELNGSRREALLQKIASEWRKPSVLDWQAYYPVLQATTDPTIDLPAAVVDDLARLVPPLQTFIADPAHSFSLPVVLNQHIVNPGHVISSSLDYLNRYTRLDASGKRTHPIFNESGVLSAEERQFLVEYGVQYVLVSPTYHRVLRHKLSKEPGAFELMYQRAGFLLYRCRTEALELDSAVRNNRRPSALRIDFKTLVVNLLAAPLTVTVAAGAAMLLLPGVLILALLTRRPELTVAEHLAFGSAVSWSLLAVMCVMAFTLNWTMTHVLAALVVLDVALAAAWWYRRPSLRTARPDLWHIAVLTGIVLTALVAYRIGGYANPESGPTAASGWSTMEEMLQVSTIRKIAESPRLDVGSVMYAKGAIPTYFYPVYPFVLAAVSRASGLDPVVLFDTFRFWTALFGLLAFCALAIAAFRRGPGTIATLTALALVLVGQAGQMTGFASWGQLIPVTHVADFGLGVLLPLALAIAVRSVTEDGRPLFTIVALPFFIAVTLTHTREAAHLVSYLGAGLLIAPLTGAVTRRQWLRLACITGVTIMFVAVYSQFAQTAVPFIHEHEQALAARGRIESYAIVRSGIGSWLHRADVPGLLAPYVTFAFVLAPAALFLFRYSPGIVILLAGLLCWWIPLHVPIVGRMLDRLVYSEMMTSPSRYVFHVSYLFYGIAVYAVLVALDRARPTTIRLEVALDRNTTALGEQPPAKPRGRAVRLALRLRPVVATCLVALVLPSLPLVFGAAFANPLAMAAVALVVARAAWTSGGAGGIGSIVTSDLEFLHPKRIGAAIAASLVVLVVLAPHNSLLEMLLSRRWPQVRDAETWYEHSAIRETLPWSTVRMLRSAIPQGAVIAADPTLGLTIPFVSNHFVLVSGTNFTTDLPYLAAVRQVTGETFRPAEDVNWASYRERVGPDLTDAMRSDIRQWESYYQQLARLVAIGSSDGLRQAPIFRPEETAATTERLLDALRPDYLLISAQKHEHLVRFIAARPDRFQAIAEDGPFRLYRPRYPFVRHADARQ